ncbi:MAG: hypothetical protein K2M22_09585 [Lachnospiraceae bacterium]|nr:hypothetical protein [Lachnospiraceae bacterium]
MIILVECVAACILFTLVVVAVSLKDPLAQVNNWPPAIQQRARELGLIREEQMSGSKKVYAQKLAAALVIAITVIAVIAGKSTAFETGRVTFLKIPLLIIGILLIILGVYLWAGALFQSKIDSHIADK